MSLTNILLTLTDTITTGDGGVKTAIIAAGGSVVVACLGVFAVLYQKRQTVIDDDSLETEPLVIELRSRIKELIEETKENRRVIREKNASLKERDKEIKRLQDNYWERGINPNTNLLIRAGEDQNENP